MKPLVITVAATLLLCAARPRLLAVVSDPFGGAVLQENQDRTSVKSTYDKAKDETTVEFQQVPMKGNETQRVLLSVSGSYKGQKPKKPEDVILIISVMSQQSYRYPDMMKMQVSVDGKKVADVLMLNLDKRRADEDYLETLGTRMKYEVFARLLKASSADLQLENLKLPLEAEHISKLRELDKLLQ